MSKARILIQLDPDSQASTFDSIVAVDSGVEHLMVRNNVTADDVEGLVHGAIFTRGPADLKNTALFFGGSNVAQTELLLEKAKSSFFGPLQVSLMADPNGANTTAAAAVLSAAKHMSFEQRVVTVLAGTGPVGMRIAHLIAGPATTDNSVTVRVCSRTSAKAESVCAELAAAVPGGEFVPVETKTKEQTDDAVCNAHAVFAAGAAGIELLGDGWQSMSDLQVAIDVNGVPPAGIAGIGVMDKAVKYGNINCYGAIGVGGLKMKIHKRCIQMLFESNDQTMEVEEIFAIGKSI